MILFVDRYLEFLKELERQRPDIINSKSLEYANISKGITQDIFFEVNRREYPTKEIVFNEKLLSDNINEVYLWHIPRLFKNKILVDFGEPKNNSGYKHIKMSLSYGYDDSFTLDLTEDAFNFVVKSIDKNIPIEFLKNNKDYKIVSVGKLGIALIKGENRYILTPIGPKLITQPQISFMFTEFVNVDVGRLLNINIINEWTEDNILQLTKDTLLGFWNMER